MDPEIKTTLLRTKPFKYLIEDELDILIQYCKMASFQANEVLFTQGKKGEKLYIIINGKASAYIRVLGKKIIKLASLEEGDFIGEVNMIEKGPCTSTVIADQPTDCLQLSSEYFDMLYSFFPEIHFKITRAITEEVCFRVQKLHKQIQNYIQQTEIHKFSFLKLFTRSHEKPTIVDFEHCHIKPHDLMQSSFFQTLIKNSFEQLISYSTLLQTMAQCSLINTNESSFSIYIVLCGAVQSSIIEGDTIAKLSVLGPMSLFVSNTLIDNNASFISYTTCERSILLMISSEKILNLESNFLLWHPFYFAICKSFIALERACDKLLIRLNSEMYNR